MLRCRAVMNNLDRFMLVILILGRLPAMYLSKRKNARQTNLWDFCEKPAQIYPGFVVTSMPPS